MFSSDFLYLFFYPLSYERMELTTMPSAGQRRIYKSFDFKMSMLNEATFDVLFTKVKVTTL